MRLSLPTRLPLLSERARALPRPRLSQIPESWLDRAPFVIATLLIAGVVHIVSVLLIPAVAPRDAQARLMEAVQNAEMAGGVALLPPATPGSAALPFEDPALALGVCAFDLSKGLLHLRAAADGEDYLGVSFHAGGRVFHALSDRAALKGKIDIVVGDEAQIAALEAEDEAPVQEVRLTAPTKHGFALIRSLAKRPSDMERARARLRGISCEAMQTPKQTPKE